MRESTLRLLFHISALALVILVLIHQVNVIVGNYDVNISYSHVIALLREPAYSISLILLLGFALLHSGLGVRRALIDSGMSNLAIRVILVIIGGVFVFIFILGLSTILTIW